ncbi:MAG: hypothetical protein HYX52_05155 [Chloroflexi bacterium]|nr:hypothetical protein [Chloroflexota bacterium]
MMTVKERLHQMVEDLPEQEASAAQRYLEFLQCRATLPPVLAEAPFDDEPEASEELAAVLEAREDLANGRIHSHREVRRLLLGVE